MALGALSTYMDDFRGRSEGNLFRTVDGRPLRNHHMNVMFTRFALQAGVAQVNPHRFRHTCFKIAASKEAKLSPYISLDTRLADVTLWLP